MQVIRWGVAGILAYLVGKLVSRCRLPGILGWLIAGMLLGPHALALIDQQILDVSWYQVVIHIAECTMGLMIGTELVWVKLKKTGRQILITTLTQSLGTFVTVSLTFIIIFLIVDIPAYLGLIFGGIALATAPAPALSVVKEYHTNGPVTRTLIPMAALDDMVGVVVFFTVIALTAARVSGQEMAWYMIPAVLLLPLAIGGAVGAAGGLVLQKIEGIGKTRAVLALLIFAAAGGGFFFNSMVLGKPILNFMLIGMAFSAVFSNMVDEDRLEEINMAFRPVLGVCMIGVILNLGAPLDYHLILGAGGYTAVYILSRAAGKYFGAWFGAKATGCPNTVRKYLGLTLLPHSGVSLVFTGIAVSVLQGPAPECAAIVQGTIAAAAVINEIIAVLVAKKGFQWAGELQQEPKRHRSAA